jgi:hypothetical protein
MVGNDRGHFAVGTLKRTLAISRNMAPSVDFSNSWREQAITLTILLRPIACVKAMFPQVR